MRIKLHIMIEDLGDGSSRAVVGPSKKFLREQNSIGEDDFHTEYGERPVEWDEDVITVEDFEVVP